VSNASLATCKILSQLHVSNPPIRSFALCGRPQWRSGPAPASSDQARPTIIAWWAATRTYIALVLFPAPFVELPFLPYFVGLLITQTIRYLVRPRHTCRGLHCGSNRAYKALLISTYNSSAGGEAAAPRPVTHDQPCRCGLCERFSPRGSLSIWQPYPTQHLRQYIRFERLVSVLFRS
jgi:hypothetical protein